MSQYQSTGSNREWALETLLKEEKINVLNLEERNQALKDRIQNLENILKSSSAVNQAHGDNVSSNDVSHINESADIGLMRVEIGDNNAANNVREGV